MRDNLFKRNKWSLYLSVVLFIVAMGYFYRLKTASLLVVITAVLLALPWIVKLGRENSREQKRFVEINLYMEQILYSFRKSPKILSALNDVEKLFGEGNMRDRIHDAVKYIQETFIEEKPEISALKIIEDAYPAKRVSAIHRIMLEVEELGGRYEDSIKILLNDRSVWEKQTYAYQKECKVQKRNILAAEILSCLFCLMTPILCKGFLKDIDITRTPVYQVGTVVALLLYMGIYMMTEKGFKREWVRDKNLGGEEIMCRKYEKVVGYDFSKARMKSLLWSLIPLVFMILFILIKKYVVSIMFLVPFLFMVNQHKIDYRLARSSVTHEIEKAFPVWLMEVSLLLQNNNVRVSIQKSRERAPRILVNALDRLIRQLEYTPESNLPYSEFLQEFRIPEVISAMGMLYSISDGSGGDAKEQIEEILMRNTELMSQAEQLANQDRLGGMYFLFLLPALLGALKMILDMTLILSTFFIQMRI